MEKEKFINSLKNLSVDYCENEPMNTHTTFKIGGNADLFVRPADKNEFISVIKAANETETPYFILGNGSNLLVSDSGIEGAVISTEKLISISVEGDVITCGAGASLRSVCMAARDNSLSGLEFAYGIPGSVGGAFYMNAGAYGGEIKDVALSAECIDKDGNPLTVKSGDMNLSYRASRFKSDGLTVISVSLKLKHGEKEQISDAMNDYFSRRADKQPLDFPSAGSTFKRPAGYYAGALIEQNGLKGRSVGGAAVSEKHAGFVINRENASASDVLALMEVIKNTVKENNGVTLESEVIFVGRKE